MAAFGLILALTWRDVISGYIDMIIQLSPAQGRIIEALLITILVVIGILIVSKIFSRKR